MRDDQPNRIDCLLEAVISGAFRLLGLIPRKLRNRLANGIGRLWYALDGRHRRIALDNLARAYAGERSAGQQRLLARAVFQNLVRVVFEMGWFLHVKPREFGKHLSVENLMNLQNAKRRGKGVLILTAHMGNWELLPSISAKTHFNADIVYRPLDFVPMDRFTAKMRSRFGAQLIPKANATLKIFRSLRRRNGVAVLFDQSVNRRRGVFVDFFGRPASTNKGLALLALKSGAPVISAFAIRENDRFVIRVGPEIPMVKTGNPQADIRVNTQRFNQVIESVVRQYPEQWFWVHRRWKVRPQ